MDAALISPDGSKRTGDEGAIRQLLGAGTPFWLDLQGSPSEALPILRDVFAFHPLAIQAAEHFGQRPQNRRLRRVRAGGHLRGGAAR